MSEKFEELEKDLTIKREAMQSFVNDQLDHLKETVDISREQISKRQIILGKRVDELAITVPEDNGSSRSRGRTFLREQARLESQSRSPSAQPIEQHTFNCHNVARMRSPRNMDHNDATSRLYFGNNTQSVASPTQPSTTPLLGNTVQQTSAFSEMCLVPTLWTQIL